MLIAALAAAAVLQAGRLVNPPASSTDRSAVLVQENIPVVADWNPAYFEQTVNDLIQLTAGAVQSNSTPRRDLVVWPESPAPFFTNDARFRDRLSQLAQQTNSWIVAGSIGSNGTTPNAEGPVFNSAAVINPKGELTARYDKVHLVPFGEYLPFPRLFSFAGGLTQEVGQFEHGTSRQPLNAGDERLGIFICYESIFPDEIRQSAAQGADLLVNISNDGWYGDSGAYAQHLNQTRMRAVENDRWLLSATDTGVTAAIDPWGRVTSSVPRKKRTALVAHYALNSVTTFYTRHGDWFAYACAIISIGALLERFTLANRKKVDTSS